MLGHSCFDEIFTYLALIVLVLVFIRLVRNSKYSKFDHLKKLSVVAQISSFFKKCVCMNFEEGVRYLDYEVFLCYFIYKM